MKYYLIISIFIFYSNICTGQMQISNELTLERVRSSKELMDFVNQFKYDEPNPIEIDSLSDNREECFGDALDTLAPWMKIDLDGDNSLDVLLNDGYGEEIAILNRGKNRPDLFYLRLKKRVHRTWCYSYRPKILAGEVVLNGCEFSRSRKYSYDKNHVNSKFHEEFMLMYKKGAFIDYVRRPRLLLPNKISYRYSHGGIKTEGLWGYEINIDMLTGSVGGEQVVFGESNLLKNFSYNLSKDQLDTLKTWLRYLNLSNIKSEYVLPGFDRYTTDLNLYYKFRSDKIISDYGGRGTHTLYAIYEFLEAIHEKHVHNIEIEYGDR